MKKHVCVYVYGPTAVGKTEFVDAIAREVPIEIINLDMGQLYTPLTIGTAKPNWRHATVPHHLFDRVSEPTAVTVVQYRRWLLEACEQIWAAGKIPVAVGGSSFYVRSIFFPPQAAPQGQTIQDDGEVSWDALNRVDPIRARAIAPNDTYRIARALEVWRSTGLPPSQFVPIYAPPSDYLFICLTRDREDLYARINERVIAMLKAGWIQEVETLLGTPWVPWLMEKKIIGYDDIITYLSGSRDTGSYEQLLKTIQQRTRNYAKRQMTFWRMLERQLVHALDSSDPSVSKQGKIMVTNLTSANSALYSVQVKNELMSLLPRE